MKKLAAAVSMLAAGAALAGGIDIKINKDAISAGPIDPQGMVVVTGAPGAVLGGMAPVRVMAQSKKTKLSSAGLVGPDGGFAVQVPSMLKDSIKITFVGADGKKKDHKVKVESLGGMLAPAPPMQTEIRTEAVTVPSGEPAAPAGGGAQVAPFGQAPPPPPAAPSDAQIVTGEKELNASGVIE